MWLKQSTAVTVKFGPFVDDADGVTALTALTISQADIRLSKNGGNIAQSNNAAGATHDELGYYDVPLDTTDTGTLGQLRVAVSESGALPVWQDFMVVPANVWDSLFGADKLQVHVDEMTAGIITATVVANGTIDAATFAAGAIDATAIADGAIDAATFAAGAITATVIATDAIDADAIADGAITSGVFAAGAITASAIAEDAIGASELAADAVTEIQSGLATAANLATVAGYLDTEIAAILADTNELQTDWADGGRLDLILDARASQTSVNTIDDFLDLEVAAILADTNELQTDWADGGRLDLILDARASQTSLDTLDNFVDTEITDIKAKTDNLPSDPADASVIAAAFATTDGLIGTVDTVVDAIKVVTDALTSAGAAKLALSAGTIIVASAITGTLTTTTMTTDLTEATDDHYNGRIVIFTSGVLTGQATDITDYTGATKLVTMTALTEAPSNGDDFIIV